MGTTAARKARLIVENTLSVLALELMCACQGLDLIEQQASPVHRAIRDHVREFVVYYDIVEQIHLCNNGDGTGNFSGLPLYPAHPTQTGGNKEFSCEVILCFQTQFAPSRTQQGIESAMNNVLRADVHPRFPSPVTMAARHP